MFFSGRMKTISIQCIYTKKVCLYYNSCLYQLQFLEVNFINFIHSPQNCFSNSEKQFQQFLKVHQSNTLSQIPNNTVQPKQLQFLQCGKNSPQGWAGVFLINFIKLGVCLGLELCLLGTRFLLQCFNLQCYVLNYDITNPLLVNTIVFLGLEHDFFTNPV